MLSLIGLKATHLPDFTSGSALKDPCMGQKGSQCFPEDQDKIDISTRG